MGNYKTKAKAKTNLNTPISSLERDAKLSSVGGEFNDY
tara:strand:- start:514 stop:627 length:114 start_codon:yes stop_codon:yes gene_type:complete